MRKTMMNAVGNAVADEICKRGLNQRSLFINSVAANLASAVAMTVVTAAVNAACAGVRNLRERSEGRALEQEFDDTVSDFCEVIPGQEPEEGEQA